MLRYLLSIYLLFLINIVFGQFVGIIPQPQIVIPGTDSLTIEKDIVIQGEELQAISYLRQNLLSRFGKLSQLNTSKQAIISFQRPQTPRKELGEEGYELVVSNGGITVIAQTPKGYFYAVNSLLQLFHYYRQGDKVVIPAMQIKDVPLFSWRGFMLDEARHFFGKKKVKQLLDYMAFYKLNKFHWHLTDEPGWRLEIKRYPYLSLIGGVGSYLNPYTPAQYYSQEDIKEIVAYAAERHIDIIPEIDMPGHATAANRAYPQYSGGGTKEHPDFTFHPAKESTYQYLTNILKEVTVLFPSGIVHLGGDEVAFGSDAWNEDVHVSELKNKLNLASNKDVERYFMQRMADSLFNLGNKLAVWDEMAEAGLPSDKTIQYWWRHDRKGQLETCLRNGYSVVICPRIPLYFDFVQAEEHQHGRRWAGNFSSLESVYQIDLSEYQQMEIKEGQILGMQANLWTERIHNESRFDFMTFPRIAALAEAAWTARERKSLEHFKQVLKTHLHLYAKDNIYYFDPFDNTHVEPKVPQAIKKYLDNPE